MPQRVEDHDLITKRIGERDAKIVTWEAEIRLIQNRIDQYRRMVARDREYLRNGSTDEEI